MLPAVHRLRSARDFNRTTRQGISASSSSVVAYLRMPPDHDDPAPARVGLVVSRSVGESVVRHRVSRRLRAAVRPLLTSLPAGSTLVLRALPSSATDARLADSTAVAVLRVVRRAGA